jgi:hypothetical protein
MFSPTVVSVAESKSPGIASTVVILSVWVYGTVLPVSGLLQNAECQRSWMTRPRTAAGHLPQICPATNFSIRRVLTPSRELVATTLTKARSARLRRSSSHSGK